MKPRIASLCDKHNIPFDLEVESAILAFVFRVMLSREFTAWLRTHYEAGVAQVAALRQDINGDGYLLTQVKPYLFYCYVNGVPRKRKKLERLEGVFDIQPTEKHLIHHLESPILANRMEGLEDYTALQYPTLRDELSGVYTRILPWTRSYVYRKLRFIYQYNMGFSQEDLVHDCVTNGMQHILFTYPKIKSRLHALNIGKGAVSRHGINLIKRLTKDDYAHLVSTHDGFRNRVSSYLPELDERLLHGASDVQQDDSAGILRRYSGRKRTTVHLLMGNYDPKFSKWLLSSNDVPPQHRMDNEALSDHLAMSDYSEYTEYVRAYMEMKPRKLTNLLADLRTLLSV